MPDKRKSEIDYVLKICEFLCQIHPELFELKTYVHPVYGQKISLKFIREDKFVDIENIVNCNIDLQNNCLFIETEFPMQTSNYNNIIKDETVV